MPSADGLIRSDAPNLAVFAVEVVKDEPAMKILLHLLGVLVAMNFGGAFLNQAFGPLNHSVGFGRVGARLAVFNCVVMAYLSEKRDFFGGAVAVFEALERELAPVIGENLLDLEGEKF